jgi:hypothetical protein
LREERGRENESFPVAEELKPQGFKERSDSAPLEALAIKFLNFEIDIAGKVAIIYYKLKNINNNLARKEGA